MDKITMMIIDLRLQKYLLHSLHTIRIFAGQRLYTEYRLRTKPARKTSGKQVAQRKKY